MGLIKQNKKSVTKKKTVRKPAKQSKKPISNAVYETKIDEILKIVQDENKVTVEELSGRVGLTLEKTESWLKILQNNALVNNHYPLMGRAYTTKIDDQKIPGEIIQNNKTRNLLAFSIVCFILLMGLYYIFMIK